MITRDNKLKIFDSFVIDRKLLKYTQDKNNNNKINDDPSNFITFGNPTISGSDGSNILYSTSNNNSFFNKIKKFFTRKEKKEKKISAIIFFENIKKSLELSTNEENRYDERVSAYLKNIENAENAGQTAFVETLKEDLNTVRYENLLFANGDIKLIKEEQVVTFIKESDKGIRLDWIKNFNRVIPDEIVNKKIEMDSLKVFDNYVVMHYDPDKKAWKETHKEKEKRKDPILFGVISGINKLYFVADWVDEYCDLTLDAFIDKYGEETIKKNNISVKF